MVTLRSGARTAGPNVQMNVAKKPKSKVGFRVPDDFEETHNSAPQQPHYQTPNPPYYTNQGRLKVETKSQPPSITEPLEDYPPTPPSEEYFGPPIHHRDYDPREAQRGVPNNTSVYHRRNQWHPTPPPDSMSGLERQPTVLKYSDIDPFKLQLRPVSYRLRSRPCAFFKGFSGLILAIPFDQMNEATWKLLYEEESIFSAYRNIPKDAVKSITGCGALKVKDETSDRISMWIFEVEVSPRIEVGPQVQVRGIQEQRFAYVTAGTLGGRWGRDVERMKKEWKMSSLPLTTNYREDPSGTPVPQVQRFISEWKMGSREEKEEKWEQGSENVFGKFVQEREEKWDQGRANVSQYGLSKQEHIR